MMRSLFQKSMSLVKKGASFFSIVALVLGTISFTIIVFSRFTPTPQVTLYEKVMADKEKYAQEYEKRLKSPHPEERELAQIEKQVLCVASGTFCHTDPRRTDDQDLANSAVGRMLSVYTFPLANMPASGLQTTQDVIARAGLVPEAIAADGSGFGGLAPYAFIWEQMRNITFIILVLVILFSGFYVMFRSSVNANVAISIENLLPKVILTMILVQMSYAIAGFMIDIMFVVSGLVISLFSPLVFPTASLREMINNYVYATPFGIVRALVGPEGVFGVVTGLWTIVYTIPDALMSIFGWQVRLIFSLVTAFVGVTVILPAMGSADESSTLLTDALSSFIKILNVLPVGDPKIKAFLTVLQGAIAVAKGIHYLWLYWLVLLFIFIPQFIIGLVLIVSLIVAAWKIFKMMFVAYIKILLFTIFAPFLLLSDIFPGKSGNFMTWVKSIASELAVFPIFIGISLFSFLIIGYEATGVGLRLPYLIGIDAQAFSYLIGISILALSPGFIDKIRIKLFGPSMNIVSPSEIQSALMQGLPYIKKPPRLLQKIPLLGVGKRIGKDGIERPAGALGRLSSAYTATDKWVKEGTTSEEDKLISDLVKAMNKKPGPSS